MTEVVIVEAVRTSDSGGELMWEPSDDMSRGEIIESSVFGSHGFAQKYCTIRINTAQIEPETSRADTSYMKKGGDKVSYTIDSWIAPVSPVAEVCCVLATLVKPFSLLIAREKTEERETVLK